MKLSHIPSTNKVLVSDLVLCEIIFPIDDTPIANPQSELSRILDTGYGIFVDQEPLPQNATYKAENQAVRIYNLNADKQFRVLLSTINTTKGSVTHRSHIFTDTYTLPPSSLICEDGLRSITIDNAGGKSDISEMYSIDYFTQMYGASNNILEKEVNYWIDYKMVDFICTIENQRVGVSVARAMGFPSPDNYTSTMAKNLLYKKLYGLIVARNGVVKDQSFTKSILHIWCQDVRIAQLLENAFSNLDENDYGLDVKGVVLLQLTICDDPQLYRNILK